MFTDFDRLKSIKNEPRGITISDLRIRTHAFVERLRGLTEHDLGNMLHEVIRNWTIPISTGESLAFVRSSCSLANTEILPHVRLAVPCAYVAHVTERWTINNKPRNLPCVGHLQFRFCEKEGYTLQPLRLFCVAHSDSTLLCCMSATRACSCRTMLCMHESRNDWSNTFRFGTSSISDFSPC